MSAGLGLDLVRASGWDLSADLGGDLRLRSSADLRFRSGADLGTDLVCRSARKPPRRS
ncbi:MAG: hypothetical protein ACTTIC_02530 [Helicobacteraceae bacterium]